MEERRRQALITAPAPDATRFFQALADETRLAILRQLVLTDLTAGEIGANLGLPQNAVSYHLRQLRDAGLLRGRPSSRDARDIYYALDLGRLEALYHAAGAALHPALPPGARAAPAEGPKLRLLFLCTHNSARSQLAEALARRIGGDGVEADSAGRDPRCLHPYTIRLLQDWGVDATRYAPKAVDQFLDQSFDYVITVCDRVREDCPTFPGPAQRIPLEPPGPDDDRRP